jgi:hypothetical protein
VPHRVHLERAAAQGDLWARAQLADGPVCPEPVAHLRSWAYELVGRSGVGMGGLAPLRYSEIEAWARLTGRCVTPRDVAALLALDRVLRQPPGEHEMVPDHDDEEEV